MCPLNLEEVHSRGDSSLALTRRCVVPRRPNPRPINRADSASPAAPRNSRRSIASVTSVAHTSRRSSHPVSRLIAPLLPRHSTPQTPLAAQPRRKSPRVASGPSPRRQLYRPLQRQQVSMDSAHSTRLHRNRARPATSLAPPAAGWWPPSRSRTLRRRSKSRTRPIARRHYRRWIFRWGSVEARRGVVAVVLNLARLSQSQHPPLPQHNLLRLRSRPLVALPILVISVPSARSEALQLPQRPLMMALAHLVGRHPPLLLHPRPAQRASWAGCLGCPSARRLLVVGSTWRGCTQQAHRWPARRLRHQPG